TAARVAAATGTPISRADAFLRSSFQPQRDGAVVHQPANIDERYLPGESPRAHAERLARDKAQRPRDPDAVVIGSDTIVVVDRDVLGKPKDDAEAATMLRRLSGRTHTVITAVAVAWRGRLESGVEEV